MKRLGVSLLAFLFCTSAFAGEYPLWDLAKANRDVLRVSTLFTAQNVRDYLASEKGIEEAIDWCRRTGVTRVFLETFRSSYWAERETLERARDAFRKAGFDVDGCVTTTTVGKKSTGWNLISCYTDVPTQETLQKIFEYTASMFDLIMIDDFLFTDCKCAECAKARGNQAWDEYHCDLMVKVCRERILGPARRVNPDVKIILKYPQWYDDFHNRGYDVVRQTEDFDWIWVGTETRDYDDERWGGKVQYEAYYIMRWLGGIGGEKTGGGWFDWLGTTKRTYLEQAIQTVLADAREMMLFCYGGLQSSTGPENVAYLREQMPRLFELAKLVRGREIRGVAAPKPPSSDPGKESYIYDFVGMMGIPLVPTTEVSGDAEAAFYPVHVRKDPQFGEALERMLDAGAPVLVTDGLADAVALQKRPSLQVLEVNGSPKSLLELTREQVNGYRNPLLRPLGLRMDAPMKVSLYLIGEDTVLVENFNDEAVDVTLTFDTLGDVEKVLTIPVGGTAELQRKGKQVSLKGLSGRTMAALRIGR